MHVVESWSRQQNAPPGFSGGGLQSWAPVAACSAHETPPRTHLPPADVQALPVADEEDVQADRIAPASKTSIEVECMNCKLPQGHRTSRTGHEVDLFGRSPSVEELERKERSRAVNLTQVAARSIATASA